MERSDSTKAYGQPSSGKAVGMAAPKRAKPGGPPGVPRGELRVYRAGSTEGRLPVSSNLRKQRSMTNLAVLTDAEKKLHLYEPKWCDDMASRTGGGGGGGGAGVGKPGRARTPGGPAGGPGVGAGGAPLSRNLSKSEHSLFTAKARPFSPLAAQSALGKSQSRIPRGPYAEVKPLSKAAPEDGKSDDEILSCKAGKGKRQGADAGGGDPGCRSSGEDGGGAGDNKAFLKVDPELVVTVLGDLEQLLFSQMLDPESQRKRTVQNVLDLRQNLEETMSSLRGSQLSHRWDESSSISSGLSDGDGEVSDNLSSEEFNVSSSLNSLPTTPLGSRRNSSIMLRTDAEKRSLVESGLSWYSEVGKPGRKLDPGGGVAGGYETGSLKTEAPSKWRKKPPPPPSHPSAGGGGGEDCTASLTGVRGEMARKPQSLGGQPGSLKKGRNPPVGVTSPITHTSQSMLKVAVAPSKPLDKSKMSVRTAGLQRSRSDAGRDHHTEYRKPPSGLTKPSAGTSFGYKKPPMATGTAAVLTAGGATLSSGSSTLGKTPKTSGIPVKPPGAPTGRKNSFDAGSEQGFGPHSRNSIQYRSLPRPAKSSTLTLIGRPGARPVSGVMDPGLLSLKPVPMASSGPRMKDTCGGGGGGGGGKTGRSGSGPGVNQTDREKEKERAKAKAEASDMDCCSLKGERGGRAEPPGAGESTVKLHGLRRTGSGKYPELSSPTTPRMLHSKSLGRPPSLAHLDKVNSNSLDSCITIQDLPPKVPPYSKLADLAGSRSATSPTVPHHHHHHHRLTPSPAPVLYVDSPGCYTSESLSLGASPLLYPKLSGVHRSMESLPLQMSVPPVSRYASRAEERGAGTWGAGSRSECHDREERGTGTWGERSRSECHDREERASWGAGSRTSLNLPDCLQVDRNTLPSKRGLERYSASLSESSDGGKQGRRHSHTVASMTDSGSPPLLPSPTRLLHPSSGKAPPTNIVAPITCASPRIARSNSIGPPTDSAYDLYGSSPVGSSLSLADRPKSMMRSGSFREAGDDVHGSVLSLASNASSNYSANEERIQGEQIRKLRRELESSQEKVANLTNQLSANANLVAAFEQSLALMTARLQTLSDSSESKTGVSPLQESELSELKETIEILKTKNTEAQEIIQGALSHPDMAPQELEIRRENSSESITSLNSITSHSSMGSLKEQEAKKKKKKSWLRSSFNKAFSKKGSKLSLSYADIEEISTPETSAPSSPRIRHARDMSPPSLKISASASSSCLDEEGEPGEEKEVCTLRSELWEKERKLTDIRLEALSSAHQLEQLQEAMTSMQRTVENLKAENDQLKTGGPPSPTPSGGGPSSSASQSSGLTAMGGTSPRLSAHLPKSYSRGLSDSSCSDVFFPADSVSSSLQRDDHRVRVVVCVADLQVFKEEVKQQDFFVGTVRVNGRMDWPMLDSAVSQALKVYIAKVDPTASLGLSTDSIYSYNMGHIKRVLGGEAPESQPSRCMSRAPTSITVALKGLKEKCVDSLVFETLIPKAMMQHYISLLLKHRRIILSGPSGTGKSYLTTRLAEYLVERSAREVGAGIVVTFNMHRQSCKDLQLYLSNLANQIDRETSTSEIPLVIILDDINDPISISELVNGALTCKYHKCPYIIGTSNQPVKMTANNSLHLSFRMVTFSNNVEPANGFLVRYLHRKLMESEDERNLTNEDLLRVLDWVPKLWYHLHAFLEKHSTSDFLIGPCFFLSCPVTVEDFRSWFIDLWNHSIIPYLQEGAKDGFKVHGGQKAPWEDPVEWVRGSLPWPSAKQDQAKLLHLPPPSGPSGGPGPASELRHQETPPSSMDSDPLMAMLLKLQEAANYIESPDKEDPSLPRL
ncbi:neuron navigator 1 isoform X4 [Gadus macrocephalus]|uniref:neuron navigator 1 isoform X4 n=1 Tax=Gadus macrocephalus TaxID=80720 RepID=UPI0028CB6FCA|nr:neuron navigator 1 isoform X4 [Gadus macrocephalus]